jgi:hypothetical protein
MSQKKDPLADLKALSSSTKSKATRTRASEQSRASLFDSATATDTGDPSISREAAETEIFKILSDTSLDSAAKIEAIAQKMTFDFADPENEAQFAALQEVRIIIAALIQDFAEQSRKSIQMTRDNPLSELTKSIRSVFENYHSLVQGRENLKQKLTIIQGFLDRDGNDEQSLLKALSDAQSKKEEKDRLQKAAEDARTELTASSDELEALQKRAAVVEAQLSLGKPGLFGLGLIASQEAKDEYKALTQEQPELQVKINASRRRLTEATEKFGSADTLLKTFVGQVDFALYEEILGILDIGNEDFKEQLRRIADQTLQYIDDTNGTLTGVRNQLSKLLTEVKKNLNVSVNTSEKLNILQQALNKAQDRNALAYQSFDAKDKSASEPVIEGLEEIKGVDEFQNKRIRQRATDFISELSGNTASTTEIAGNMATHQTSLRQLRDDLETGVANADSQLLKAISTSAATGQTMLQRTERLAAMSQKIVADSVYDQEMREAFQSVVKDFQSGLEDQLRRNSEIEGFGSLVSSLTEALDAKNDAAIHIATEQQQLVERLSLSVQQLEQANLRSDEVKSRIAVETAERRGADSQ